jgi:hypothetical protein
MYLLYSQAFRISKREKYTGNENHSSQKFRKWRHFGTGYHTTPSSKERDKKLMRIRRVAGLA